MEEPSIYLSIWLLSCQAIFSCILFICCMYVCRHNIVFSLRGNKGLYQTSCSVMALPVLSRAAFGILQRPLVLLYSEHVKVVGLPERRFLNHIRSGSCEGRGSKHHFLAEVPEIILANAPITISHHITTRWSTESIIIRRCTQL